MLLTHCRLQNKKLSCRRDHSRFPVTEYFAKLLKITQDHSNWYHSYSRCIVTTALYCIVFEIKEILVETRIFHTPTFDAPVRVPVGILNTFWYGKSRMVSLPDGEKSLWISLVVSTEYRRVADRRTDRQASCAGIIRVLHSITR